MATVNPPLGAVSLGSHLAAITPHPDEVVVGDPPQWSDGSDATYALIGSPDGAPAAKVAYARTEPISGEVIRATVTIRAKAEGGDTDVVQVYAGRTTGASFPPLFAINDIYIPNDGAIHESTSGIDFGPELTEVTQPEWSSIGFHVEVVPQSAAPRALTVYEVDLVLTLATTTVPVTRLHPRKDGLGPMGSAPRLVGEWPPERLIRY